MAETEAAPPPKKKGKRALVLILVALVALGGGGAAAFVLLKDKGAEGEAPEASKPKGKPAEPGVISLDAFITNLAGPDSDRYVKCTLRLEIDRKETADKLKASDISITRLRDRILTLLASKRFDEVASPEGKERLRDEIRARVEPLLEAGAKVSEVYYSEFIVQ